jgi:NAD(P)-dependent dehydrogenase (short-subunit alcohol dehydrogenase family)
MKKKATKPLIKSPYSWRTKATTIASSVNLLGKVILITGATNGVGLATTKALVKTNASIIAAVRNTSLAKARFKKYPNIIIKYLDLDNYHSILKLIEEIKIEGIKIDYLINNAGIMGGKKKVDEIGIERHFKVNYLGSFILTNGLLNNINNGGRIINLSSVAHKWSRLHFEDINFDSRPYKAKLAYAQSKTAGILFSQKLANILAPRNICVFSVHPGIIPLSNIWTPRNIILKKTVTGLIAVLKAVHITSLLNIFTFAFHSNIVGHFKTSNQGASTTIWSLTDETLPNYNGAYLEDCNLYPIVDEHQKVATGLAKYASDTKKMDLLWDYSIRYLKKLNIYNEVFPKVI